VYHFVCNYDQLVPNKPFPAEVDERFVIVTLIDNEVYCIEDVCTHDGGALGDGETEDHCIACPRHGAKFDLRTGEALTMPATEATNSFKTKVEDGKVYVSVDE
jgi:3-phenylpropionate/trans-cinnamate dioxygenase ferredoxin subunit